MKVLAKLVLVSVIVMGLMGCQTIGNIMGQEELTPKETYYEAITFYNSNLELYLDLYDVSTPEAQAEFKKDVDPIFIRAGNVLEVWGRVLGAESERDQIIAWTNVKNLLIMELIAIGVLGD